MRNRKHDIERYLRGELSPAEMHALEKEALKDPFLAEALEGIEQAGADNFLYDLHKIRRSVREATLSRSRKNNKTIRMWGWTSAIAASVLLVAVSGFMVINLLKEQARREQAMRAEPELMPGSTTEKDTLTIILPAESQVKKKANTGRSSSAVLPQAPGASTRTSEAVASEAPPDDETQAHEAIAQEDAPARDQAENAESIDVSEKDQVAVTSSEEARAEEQNSQESISRERSVSRALEGRAAGVQSKDNGDPPVDEKRSPLLRGRVTSDDGEALPGVNVMIRGTSIGAVTDADGKYELSLPPDKRTVVFAFIGFESHEVYVGDKAEVNVSLKPDVSALSEVVVTGYGSVGEGDRSSTFHLAEPAGGRSDFREYLSRAVRYPDEALKTKTEGRVTVRFTVEPDGTVSEFEVIKGIGAGCEEELIRAIKSGPAWKASSRGGLPLRDKVKVRYRFVLPD